MIYVEKIVKDGIAFTLSLFTIWSGRVHHVNYKLFFLTSTFDILPYKRVPLWPQKCHTKGSLFPPKSALQKGLFLLHIEVKF